MKRMCPHYGIAFWAGTCETIRASVYEVECDESYPTLRNLRLAALGCLQADSAQVVSYR